MPIYIYKAKKGPAEVVNGEMDAVSRDQAVSKLEEMRLTPVSVVEKAAYSVERDERLAYSVERIGKNKLSANFVRVKSKDMDIFTRQLSSLVRARVPMLQALSLIFEQTENRVLKNVVNDLKKQIKDGKVLSDAMSGFPRLFNNLYLNMIKSGEKAGVLGEVLFRLAEHREREQEIRRRIQAAMAYPLLMIIVGISTVFVMLAFFLPKLTSLFENMNQALPMPTQILISISEFMSANWHWFLAALVLIAAIFGRVKPGSRKKFLFDMVKLRLPFMKKLVMNAEICKFARTMGLLLKNGLPVYESLELATGTLDNDALRERLGQAGKEIINQGYTLSASLKKINIFPKFAVNMIAVAEEGGKLEESLSEIARVYEKEVEQTVKIMASLLEPLLILAVGAVVGFIVFAMLLPIFNIGGMAG